MEFKEGQYVSFVRSHDRVHVLEGYIDTVQGDEVLVETEPDGVLVWANAADVKVVADSKAPQTKQPPADAAELVAFVMSRGYGKDAAESIVAQHADAVRADRDKAAAEKAASASVRPSQPGPVEVKSGEEEKKAQEQKEPESQQTAQPATE